MENGTIIKCYVTRHGQPHKSVQTIGHKLDALTQPGAAHAAATALANYGPANPVTFDAVYFSGMNRALETVQQALKAIGQDHLPIVEEPGFGFTWVLKDPALPPFDFFGTEGAMVAKNGDDPRATMLYEWFEPGVYPPIWAIRGRLIGALMDVSRRAILDNPVKRELNILIGSHGPTGEAAALDPSTTPCLRFCDTICYKLMVVDGKLEITASESIFAPDF